MIRLFRAAGTAPLLTRDLVFEPLSDSPAINKSEIPTEAGSALEIPGC